MPNALTQRLLPRQCLDCQRWMNREQPEELLCTSCRRAYNATAIPLPRLVKDILDAIAETAPGAVPHLEYGEAAHADH